MLPKELSKDEKLVIVSIDLDLIEGPEGRARGNLYGESTGILNRNASSGSL